MARSSYRGLNGRSSFPDRDTTCGSSLHKWGITVTCWYLPTCTRGDSNYRTFIQMPQQRCPPRMTFTEKVVGVLLIDSKSAYGTLFSREQCASDIHRVVDLLLCVIMGVVSSVQQRFLDDPRPWVFVSTSETGRQRSLRQSLWTTSATCPVAEFKSTPKIQTCGWFVKRPSSMVIISKCDIDTFSFQNV